MFRVKVVITFFVLLGVLTGGAYFVLNGQVQDALEQNAQASLRRSATVAQQSLRLDEFALIEKARFTARGEELYSTMKLNDNELLYDQLFARYPEATTAGGVRHVAVYDEPLKVDEVRLKDAAKSAAKLQNADRKLYERTPAVPDIFMVLDQNGKGVAALGKGRKRWWDDNVAKKHPAVLKAVQDNKVLTDIWKWRWNDSDSEDLYRVAIVPIRPTASQAARGVVVAGTLIHDGLAHDAQDLLAGFAAASEADPTSSAVSPPEFAFFRGDQIVASTFRADDEDALASAAFGEQKMLEADTPDTLHSLEVGGHAYQGLARFFPNQIGVADAPSGFIVLSPQADTVTPITQAATNIFALAAGVLLVGIILILFFIQSARKPLAEIETGMGEVLAGNKDYVFETSSNDETYLSIFQGLNLMSAYLQGKPMPDDPDAHGDWGELMVDNDANANAAPGKVTGVSLPGMGPKRKSSAPVEPGEDQG